MTTVTNISVISSLTWTDSVTIYMQLAEWPCPMSTDMQCSLLQHSTVLCLTERLYTLRYLSSEESDYTYPLVCILNQLSKFSFHDLCQFSLASSEHSTDVTSPAVTPADVTTSDSSALYSWLSCAWRNVSRLSVVNFSVWISLCSYALYTNSVIVFHELCQIIGLSLILPPDICW